MSLKYEPASEVLHISVKQFNTGFRGLVHLFDSFVPEGKYSFFGNESIAWIVSAGGTSRSFGLTSLRDQALFHPSLSHVYHASNMPTPERSTFSFIFTTLEP